MLRELVVVLSLASVILAVHYAKQSDPKPDPFKAEGCSIDGRIVPFGKSVSSREGCIEYTCNGGGLVTGVTCGSEAVLPPCYLKEADHTKPYPECCYRETVCP